VLGAEAWRVYDAKHKKLPAEDSSEIECVTWDKHHHMALYWKPGHKVCWKGMVW